MKQEILDTFIKILNDGGSLNQDIIIKTGLAFNVPQEEIELTFPSGVNEIIDHLAIHLNKKTEEFIKQTGEEEFLNKSISGKIKNILYYQADELFEHKKALRALTRYFFKPQNYYIGTKILYKLADNAWKLSHDKSLGFTFYSKRTTLCAIYSSLFFYIACNKVSDTTQVREFIDSRMNNVTTVAKTKQKIKNVISIGQNKIKNKFNELFSQKGA